jgi:methylmalonyl-CoA mutase N-terminal domain/subunit
MLEGVLRRIEERWFQTEIAESAYTFERKVSSRRRLVAGVNAFYEGNEEPAPPTLQIGLEIDEAQRKRLDSVRRKRSSQAVDAALEKVAADAADPLVNLVPSILAAARAYATVGEVVGALASVFGRWAEDPVL